ncbi:ATP-binding protein [Runella sp.]|uniref:ATP-binding protein n=1 Tax=Runella sp. TaxID=1960881 RepID=UPI003D11C923
MKAKLYLFLFPFFFCFSGHAQQPIIVTDSVAAVSVGEFASVFKDKEGTMPFEKVQQQAFLPNQEASFRFYFSPGVFWFRFRVDNQSRLNQNNWYFLWSDGLNNHVDLYLPQQNGSYKVLKGGILAKASEKAYQGLFPLYTLGALPDSTVQTFYVRLEAGGSLNGQLTLMTHQAFIDVMPTMLAMVWLVIGVQLLRVLYNIILARYIRNIAFRWYSFHTVIVTLSVLGSFGVTGNVLSHYPEWGGFFNSIFYQLMPATYTLFIYALLNIRVNYPRLRGVFFFIIGSSFLQVPLYFVVPQTNLLIFHNYLFLFTEAFLSVICIYSLVKRLPMNKYLLIPCFFTLIPFAFLNLSALGHINYSWIYPMIYITNFLEILALALVLGKIIEATEQEKLKTQQALLVEKLEAEKLQELDAVKSRFFTNISHEFRTPLTLLVGPLTDMGKKYPAEKIIPAMQRNVNRLQNLINQLLDLSKLEAKQLKVEWVESDLSVFLQQLLASYESLAQNRKILFNYSQNRTTFRTFFDADKIEKIVTNLLSNAFKFTPENGRIIVNVNHSENWLTLKVQDYGIGIEADRIPHIFDRFYQVQTDIQRNYEGTGIGLALVKELVEVLNGRISVESKPGRGTAFTVMLPQAPASMPRTQPGDAVGQPLKPLFIGQEERPEQIASAEPLGETDRSGQLPILLIVEDNSDLRAYVRSIFEHNYQIIEAIDGEIGLQKAFEYVPDAVVCDLMMPRLDGLAFCQTLKSDIRTNHIPVVMLTAKATLDDRLEGLKLGADDYLSKPFNREELEIRIQNLLKQRETLRQKYALKVREIDAENEKEATPDDPFLQKAREIVKAHLSNSSFDVEQFCKLMGMSRTNLHRKLKALTETSTTEFIRVIRLQRAAQLLRQRAGTVSEIAYKVGFESLPYFSKSFQEQFGISPSEWAHRVDSASWKRSEEL